jgi:glycosyltransferase involved in cell wall biosynthesis
MSDSIVQYRVLILDNEFEMGGKEKSLFQFISRTDRNRFHIAICCLKEGGYFKPKLEAMGVPFHDGLLRHRFDALAFRKFASVLRREQARIIYTFAHPNTVIFSLLARRLGLADRVVVSFHSTGNPLGGRLLPPYLRALVRRADALLAVAQMQKDYLVRTEGLPAGRIRVIHNGVDVSVYHPPDPGERERIRAGLGVPARAYVMVAVASLKPAKRIDLLMRAAAPLMRARSDAHLLLVGDGPDRAELEALARELGTGERVRFAGIRDDVPSVLRASDVLVLSSRAGTETFPNVVLEAMATGLPVISTDVGSVQEMVEEGRSALVVPRENESALRSAIERVAADPGLRASFGARGREIVDLRYRMETMCAARQALIAELGSGAPAHPARHTQ